MLDADKSHLDVTWVSQSLYSGPLSNPDFFLSLIAGRIRQVVLYLNALELLYLELQILSLNELCHKKTCYMYLHMGKQRGRSAAG